MVLLRFNFTLVYCYGTRSALCPPSPPSSERLAEPSPLRGALEGTQPRLWGHPGALPSPLPSGALALLRTRPFATFFKP